MEDIEKRTKNDVNNNKNPYNKKGWIIAGLFWGALMFVLISIIYPYFNGDEITLKTLLLGIVLWTLGGIGFGYTMNLYIKKTNKNK